MCEFSPIQLSVLLFFETKVQKSDLFKIQDKIDKKAQEVEKNADKDRAQKETQLKALLSEQVLIRKEALRSVIPDWLTECAEKAVSVGKPMMKVSHPVKFTHGMIPYGGIYVSVSSSNQDHRYISTTSLDSSYFDIAMSNGNLVTHGRFLQALVDGVAIYEKLERDDDAWLSEFSTDKQQIATWSSGLKQWLGAAELTETSRLKQNYFPTSEGQYHLIAPLLSSPICQAIYERTRFNSKNAKRKKARKDGKYAEGETVDFPSVGIMNFGGSQPQNISIGNFERHGEAHLFSCAPPRWKSDFKPPINAESLYQGEFNHRVWRQTKVLQHYLVELHGQKGNMKVRENVKYLVNDIIDELLSYVAQVQSLTAMSGWTKNAEKLKTAHKLWLDPFREDQRFQDLRRAGDWQDDVCKDFGEWLNGKLEHKKMVFEKIESKHWAQLLKKQLREFERGLEVRT